MKTKKRLNKNQLKRKILEYWGEGEVGEKQLSYMLNKFEIEIVKEILFALISRYKVLEIANEKDEDEYGYL